MKAYKLEAAKRYREKNKEKIKEKARLHYANNIEKMRIRANESYHRNVRDKTKAHHYFVSWSLKKRYGITLEEKCALYDKQLGQCGICKSSLEMGKKTHVDHDHKTGTIRGLLCHWCNQGLGNFKDNVESLASAMRYLGYARL